MRNQLGVGVAHTVTSKWSKGTGGPAGNECQNLVPFAIKTSNTKQNGTPISKDKAHTLDCAGPQAVAFTQNTRDEVRKIGGDGQIAGALGAEEGMKQRTYLAVPQAQVYENHPADSRMKECGDVAPTVTSRFGTGGGNVPIVKEPVPINTQLGLRGDKTSNTKREGVGIGKEGDPMFTLQENHSHAVAFTPAEARRSGTINPQDTAPTLTSQTKAEDTMPCIQTAMQVRRLTPRECERLQGFPDDYTLIPFRGKPASDGPRYKALGNSMNAGFDEDHPGVMRWLGLRIALIDSLIQKVRAA